MKVLTRERKRCGWSKAELARRARMNQVTVGQIENGLLVPYPVQLKKLAAALSWDGDPEVLLEEVPINEEYR